MAGLAKFLPGVEQLLRANSTAPVAPSALAGKTVFFYFSASWCPPCRGFTPQLTEFYNKFHEKKNFEVVFVTWDEETEAWRDYFKKMPWLALDMEKEQATMQHLTKGFDVQSIPTLIGVDADTGRIVTTNARTMVVKDPEGNDFPWGKKEGSNL
ncbi:tryparedoxin [Strigomonas culicis]|uniref:Tryparedoxin n=1 Tax=Strigomonas culicis TaxID=28005 RepID=S9VSR1_9TRYP|nr:tryparedoxin [Strigomonas culicis]EPY35803.1 tryparedoxin [Strigomonas culicis]|eukprot:EPY30106.1 tryparedoxin [Strigomonas culicis]